MPLGLYDPALGSFLQVDPVEGGSANDYEHCFGGPVNCVDLTGNAGAWVDNRDIMKFAAKICNVSSDDCYGMTVRITVIDVDGGWRERGTREFGATPKIAGIGFGGKITNTTWTHSAEVHVELFDNHGQSVGGFYTDATLKYSQMCYERQFTIFGSSSCDSPPYGDEQGIIGDDWTYRLWNQY